MRRQRSAKRKTVKAIRAFIRWTISPSFSSTKYKNKSLTDARPFSIRVSCPFNIFTRS
jgi:hypothetical protein